MRRNGLWKRVATAAACTAVAAAGLTGCKVAVSEEIQAKSLVKRWTIWTWMGRFTASMQVRRLPFR